WPGHQRRGNRPCDFEPAATERPRPGGRLDQSVPHGTSMNQRSTAEPWRDVLDFWFSEGCAAEVSAKAHLQHWSWRMHGGADEAIIARFAELTALAARGELD